MNHPVMTNYEREALTSDKLLDGLLLDIFSPPPLSGGPCDLRPTLLPPTAGAPLSQVQAAPASPLVSVGPGPIGGPYQKEIYHIAHGGTWLRHLVTCCRRGFFKLTGRKK